MLQEKATRKLAALLFSWHQSLFGVLRTSGQSLARAEWPEYPTQRYLATLSLLLISLIGISLGQLLTPLQMGGTLHFELPTFSPDYENETQPPQTPEGLVGQTRQALVHLFGEAEMIRTEAALEIWQYRTRSCVLDVYLKNAGDVSHITYAEVRARHGSPESQLDAEGVSLCLSMLAQGNSKQEQ